MNSLKFFFTAICLANGCILFAQVITHLDTLDNEFDKKVQSLLGNDFKGQPIPDFVIYGEKGVLLTRDSLRSKVTFFNFWSLECDPCKVKFQALEKFYVNNKSRSGFTFASITFEPDSVIARIRKEEGLHFPIYHLSQDSCRQIIGKMGYPATLIVGRNGVIAYSTAGGSLDPVIEDKHLNHFIQAELEKCFKVPEVKVF